MRLYIAGPMTGLPDFNYPAFNAMEAKLKELGHDPDNPARHFGGRQDLPKDVYMRAAIEAVLRSEGVVLLSGWELSDGAWVEAQVAEAIGLDFFGPDLMFLGNKISDFLSLEAILSL